MIPPMRNLRVSLVLLGFLVGCSVTQSGELPLTDRFDTLKKGDSLQKVQRMLGPPAFEEKDGTHFMVYARNIKKGQGFMPDKEIERDVYVLTFDKKDRLLETTHLTLADARSVSFDPDMTQTQHADPSFLTEIMGNFGKYNTGQRDSIQRQ